MSVFSGLVEEIGTLLDRDGDLFRFAADRILYDTRGGDFLAVNGCGLSVVDVGDDWLTTELTGETISCTTFGSLVPGMQVNLERSMRASDRIKGSFYQGFVDGVGEIITAGEVLAVRVPKEFLLMVAPRGAIAVDGVALAVVEATEEQFTAALTDHTMDRSTLGSKKIGEMVNLEFEPVAKYVSRALSVQALG